MVPWFKDNLNVLKTDNRIPFIMLYRSYTQKPSYCKKPKFLSVENTYTHPSFPTMIHRNKINKNCTHEKCMVYGFRIILMFLQRSTLSKLNNGAMNKKRWFIYISFSCCQIVCNACIIELSCSNKWHKRTT